jgi:gas vesicle protein
MISKLRIEESSLMNLESKQTRGLLIGALIGAIIGAGAAYLLLTAPGDEDDETEPIAAKDLLSLTGTAALLIRKLDDVRRKT